MASLQARSALRSAHPLFFVNKIVSLTAFIVLLGAGWVVLSYLKNDVFGRWQTGGTKTIAAAAQSPIPEQTSAPQINSLVPASRLVYSCASDKDYYHASNHLPDQCERTVLSEEAALNRGLKRCKKCFPD